MPSKRPFLNCTDAEGKLTKDLMKYVKFRQKSDPDVTLSDIMRLSMREGLDALWAKVK